MKGDNTSIDKPILAIEPNPCIFSAYFIDLFIVLMGFWLSFATFILYTWWSLPLSLIILLVSLGLGKSLFLKNIFLYKDRIVLKWYLFKDKIIPINKIKEVRDMLVGFYCMKFTFLEKQPFDYNSIWVIANESIIGTDKYLMLENEIKKLVGGK